MKAKINIHQLFWYFILFSILGLIIETLYGYFTMGIWESRKGLIWGPFCPVYGVGAIFLIFFLNHVDQKSYFKLFFYGVLTGAAVEYVLSYGLEAIYGARFWDYSYAKGDINGRICIIYSLFWGILAIGLMKLIKPLIDKIIERINLKIKASTEMAMFLFLAVDALVTVWAVSIYEKRAICQFYQEEMKYSQIPFMRKIEEEYFTDTRMKKTFPNLRTKDREGNQVFIRDLIKEEI
ncbi:MAG: putative ABC transporter permease [Clostridia bacterium]|nr:putative ABC transporter permease [Clostridia bacterium]